jgi:hypothetical protein
MPIDQEEKALGINFSARVAVRPARLVFQHYPHPRTAEIAKWIQEHQAGGADSKKAPYAPFVYRGSVAAHPEKGADIEVHLWEEPSGRPLEGQLPLEWFEPHAPYKGMPFRLVTWMVEAAPLTLITRHRIELLSIQGEPGIKL